MKVSPTAPLGQADDHAKEIPRLRQRIIDLAELDTSRAREECNAEPGEECRPYCIGAAHHEDENAETTSR